MQGQPTVLAELAERVSDTLRALLTEASRSTGLTDELDRTEPPPELYRAARAGAVAYAPTLTLAAAANIQPVPYGRPQACLRDSVLECPSSVLAQLVHTWALCVGWCLCSFWGSVPPSLSGPKGGPGVVGSNRLRNCE